MHRKLIPLFAMLIFALFSCSASRPTPSAPQTYRLETDAGALLCAYVVVRQTETSEPYVIACCADDESKVARAVEMVQAAYPIAKLVAERL